MLKKLLYGLVSILALICILFYFLLYPRLPIITGYAAKATCSAHFLADRNIADIKSQDLNFSPINLSSIRLEKETLVASTSILGMQSQTAIYKKGFGCVLIHDVDDYNIEYPKYEEDSIQYTSAPNYSNISNARFEPALSYVFKDSFKTRAVLIYHKDTLVAEKYANGINSETPLLGWSMTKSVTNALIGIAIKDGLLNLSDDHLFPQWEQDDRKYITLNELLQMRSGLEWIEDYTTISDVTEMLYMSENVVRDASDNPLGSKKWYYASGTTNLLLGILRNALDNDSIYWTFPKSRLFDPLGMKSMLIEPDESGNFIGSSYGYATARDWLAFGKFYLHNGVTESGESLLPENWVSYSTTPVSQEVQNYGAQWWLNQKGSAYPDVPWDLFSANGFQGQFVFVIPSLDLVVVRLGLNNDFDKNYFLTKVIAGL